jgi:hypothetical protein
LLGFIEGDGSFSVSTYKSFTLRINIVQSIIEKRFSRLLNYFY